MLKTAHRQDLCPFTMRGFVKPGRSPLQAFGSTMPDQATTPGALDYSLLDCHECGHRCGDAGHPLADDEV